MKTSYKLSLIAASVLLCAAASAQNAPQSNTIGDGGGSIDQQIIGDTVSTADRTNSVSTQLGNSANANGATVSPNIDTRDQNTNNVQGGAGGASTATGANQSVTAGRADVNLGPVTTGPSTSSTGPVNATTGPSSATTNGTNTGTNAQGQQVRDSGNGTATGGTANGTNTGANTGTVNGTNTSRTNQAVNAGNGAGASAGAGAGAGAGSGNKTANTTTVQGDTDRSRTQVWANPVIHGAGAAAVPSANMIQQKGTCGPRLRTITTQVTGIRFGFFGGQSEVHLGYTDKVGVYLNEDGTRGDLFLVDTQTGWLIGDKYDTYGAVLSVSSANSLSLAGFSGGDALQGGAASSGGMQTIGLKIVIAPCVMDTKLEALPAAAAPVAQSLPIIRAPGQ